MGIGDMGTGDSPAQMDFWSGPGSPPLPSSSVYKGSSQGQPILLSLPLLLKELQRFYSHRAEPSPQPSFRRPVLHCSSCNVLEAHTDQALFVQRVTLVTLGHTG